MSMFKIGDKVKGLGRISLTPYVGIVSEIYSTYLRIITSEEADGWVYIEMDTAEILDFADNAKNKINYNIEGKYRL